MTYVLVKIVECIAVKGLWKVMSFSYAEVNYSNLHIAVEFLNRSWYLKTAVYKDKNMAKPKFFVLPIEMKIFLDCWKKILLA